MSPAVQRLIERSQGWHAASQAESTLGDRIAADRRFVDDREERIERSIHDEEVQTFRDRVAASW